jgi:acyl-CoA synthetase (AMP-forming)/AMP-acid ligase II
MLAETVRQAAGHFGDRPAYIGWDGTLTYAELDTRSSELAGALVAGHGIGERDVVVLRLPSGIDYLVAYAAAAKVGAVTAGISPFLAPAEQQVLIDKVQPRLIIDELTGLNSPPATIAPLRPDDTRPVVIVFTSGTTGVPKGAWFTGAELRAAMTIDLGPDPAWGGGGAMLAGTQFAHVGLMTKLPAYLRSGATLIVREKWRADDVLRDVAEHRIATIGGVAPQIALLLRSPLFDDLDLSCVQRLVVGGALSTPALVREARRRFGADYSIRYSSTESGGVGLGTAFDAEDDEALHTIGRPRPGVEARIAEPDADGIGELCLRSAAQTRGYWNDPDATAATIDPNGWLHTGDLARIDADERFRLAGRIKEMYVRGGYNVFPAEVEAVLADHPAIAEVAVAPRTDEVMGEVGVAVIALRPGAEAPSLDELRASAADRLAAWKLPEALVVVDRLPRNPLEKIDRQAVARVVG